MISKLLPDFPTALMLLAVFVLFTAVSFFLLDWLAGRKPPDKPEDKKKK